MADEIVIQLGLFGGENEVAGMHIVSAHTRIRDDGSEVFVGEHVRWNRGRQAPVGSRTPRPSPAPDGHPSLFDPPEPPPLEDEPQLSFLGPLSSPR